MGRFIAPPCRALGLETEVILHNSLRGSDIESDINIKSAPLIVDLMIVSQGKIVYFDKMLDPVNHFV